MNKDLLSGFDLTRNDIDKIYKLTSQLKKKTVVSLLEGKVIGLIFQKPSVRTRVSFEAGARQLGAQCIYFAPDDIQLGKREPIKDTARVLSRYLEGIIARTFAHEHVLEIAKYARISVINGLSDLYHPCQALADIYTIYEKVGSFKDVKLAFVGDGSNVLHSLLAVASKVGLSVSAATPKGYRPKKDIWNAACRISKQTKAKLTFTHNPQEAVKGADFVYTDVWTSMGQEKQRRKRVRDFQKFQINGKLLKMVGKKYSIMHCMPVHRGEEITDEIIESKESIVFDQAENRLHVQKAIMALLMK